MTGAHDTADVTRSGPVAHERPLSIPHAPHSLLPFQVLVQHDADVSGADHNGKGCERDERFDLVNGGPGVGECVGAGASSSKADKDKEQGEEGAHFGMVSRCFSYRISTSHFFGQKILRNRAEQGRAVLRTKEFA